MDDNLIEIEFDAEPEWKALLEEIAPLLVKAPIERLRSVLEVLKD